MFEFLDLKTILVIFHLLGVALGVGGAIASDLMFFKTMKDGRITKTEMSFLNLGSTMVWSGLVLLILSGIAMFLLNPEGYLASSKFISKMTIVGILTANAFVFHLVHIPRLRRHIDMHCPESDEFMRGRPSLLVSGVVSIVSWICAMILGAISTIPYPVTSILGAYVLVLLLGLMVAFIFKNQFIPVTQSRE